MRRPFGEVLFVIKVGIVGASGYTGGELMRILLAHPHVALEYVGSRSLAGKNVRDVMPAMPPWCDLTFEAPDPDAMADRCDVLFTATPRGAAIPYAEAVAKAGKALIDIGTDFRFRNVSVYEAWYGLEHTAPGLSRDAAYGLPELFREDIRGSRIVGNPGCYPTSILLGLAPLVKADRIHLDKISITAYSGISGAGATPKSTSHLPEAAENLQPYGVAGHRHTPEIEQGIQLLRGESPEGAATPISFTPHLAPMSRGILSTMVLYPKGEETQEGLQGLYEEFYEDEPFVRVLGTDRLPQTKPLRGTNLCDVAVRWDDRAGRIIVMAAIDNLVKGAAGQAVQNMNILFELPEATGLELAGLYP